MVAPNEGSQNEGKRSMKDLEAMLRALTGDESEPGDVDKVEPDAGNPCGLPAELADTMEDTLASALTAAVKALRGIDKVDDALSRFEKHNKLSTAVAGRHRACAKWTCMTMISLLFDTLADIRPSAVPPKDLPLNWGGHS